MKKRHIFTRTVLEPYGLVRISAQVERNEYYDGYQKEPYEPPFEVSSLRVIDSDGDDITDELERIELEKVHEVLIEKFLDDEQAYQDTLIDEAIQRGRELARHAYE